MVFRHPATGAPGSKYQSGLDALAARDFNAALALFEELVAAEPTPAHFFHRGLSRFRVGDTAGAIADYDRAIELAPEYVDAFWRRGQARAGAEGIDDMSRAIALDPNCAAAWAER